jgi:glycerophosphoryl diester phosphodiesterase
VIQSFETANLKYLSGQDAASPRPARRWRRRRQGRQGHARGRPFDRPYDFAVTGDKRTFQDMVSAEGLKEIATYADGVGPWKPYIMASKQVIGSDGKPQDLNKDGAIDERDRVLIAPTDVVKNAHAVGLFVFSWTFRSEPKRLTSDFKDDPAAEYRLGSAGSGSRNSLVRSCCGLSKNSAGEFWLRKSSTIWPLGSDDP